MIMLGGIVGVLHGFLCMLIIPYFAVPVVSFMTLSDDSLDSREFGIGYTIAVLTTLYFRS